MRPTAAVSPLRPLFASKVTALFTSACGEGLIGSKADFQPQKEFCAARASSLPDSYMARANASRLHGCMKNVPALPRSSRLHMEMFGRRLGFQSFYVSRHLSKKKADDDATVEVVEEEAGANAQPDKEGEDGNDAAKAGQDGLAAQGEGKEKSGLTDVKNRVKEALSANKKLTDEDLVGLEDLELKEIIELLGNEDGTEEVFFEPGTKEYLPLPREEEVGEDEDDAGAAMDDTFVEEETVPRLSEESKKQIYQLHSDNPSKNTIKELSNKFGIAPSRCEAIIYLQRLVHEMEAKGLTPEEKKVFDWGAQVHKQMEEDYGSVRTGYQSDGYADELAGFRGVLADVLDRDLKARPRPLYQVLGTQEARKLVSDIQKWRENKDKSMTPRERGQARLSKAAKAVSTVVPMEQWHGVQPTSSKRWNYVFADISKGMKGESRWIAVRDKSGELRPANFEERFRTEQIISPIVMPRR